MNVQQMVVDKAGAWKWAMDWAEQGAVGAKHIRECATQVKDRYFTDGLWNPDAEIVHMYLLEAAEMAVA